MMKFFKTAHFGEFDDPESGFENSSKHNNSFASTSISQEKVRIPENVFATKIREYVMVKFPLQFHEN